MSELKYLGAKGMNYSPIVVGEPEDWMRKDENGEYIDRDAYGNPIPYDPYWVAARRNANGHRFDMTNDGRVVGACVGGSAASEIVGLFEGHEHGCKENTFNPRLHTYYSIRNEDGLYEDEDKKKEEIFFVGHIYEDAIAQASLPIIQKEFLDSMNLKGYLVNDARMFQCGVEDEDGNLAFPHAIADMDRLIYCYLPDTKVNLDDKEWVKNNPPVMIFGDEIKSTRKLVERDGNLVEKWRITEDNPVGAPENYQVQTHHYMAVGNLDGFFICCQAYSMLPSEMVVRYVPRDKVFEERLLREEEMFIQNALDGIMPTPNEDVSSKWLKEFGLHSTPHDEVKKEEGFELDKNYHTVALKMLSVDEEIARIKKEKDKQIDSLMEVRTACEAQLAPVFADEKKSYSYFKGDLNGVKGRLYIRQNHKKARSPKLDIEGFKEKFPELAAKCVKESVVKTGLNKLEKEKIAMFEEVVYKPDIETSISFVES